jgi:hypothetical protein
VKANNLWIKALEHRKNHERFPFYTTKPKEAGIFNSEEIQKILTEGKRMGWNFKIVEIGD